MPKKRKLKIKKAPLLKRLKFKLRMFVKDSVKKIVKNLNILTLYLKEELIIILLFSLILIFLYFNLNKYSWSSEVLVDILLFGFVIEFLRFRNNTLSKIENFKGNIKNLNEVTDSFSRNLFIDNINKLNKLSETEVSFPGGIIKNTTIGKRKWDNGKKIFSIKNSDLNYSEITNVVFRNINMENIELYASVLTNVEFVECNLTGAKFIDSDLENIKFFDCKLSTADFGDCRILACKFYKCHLEETGFEGVGFEKTYEPGYNREEEVAEYEYRLNFDEEKFMKEIAETEKALYEGNKTEFINCDLSTIAGREFEFNKNDSVFFDKKSKKPIYEECGFTKLALQKNRERQETYEAALKSLDQFFPK
jgi:uncharacterized protein YjbI with pentapeptide repeats